MAQEQNTSEDFDLDDLLEKEAQESDQYERDHLRETKDSINSDRPTVYNNPEENKIINLKRGNTRHQPASGEIDEAAIAEEAKEGLESEAQYLRFKATLDKEVSEAYKTVFGKEPEPKYASFVKDIIKYRNGLCNCSLTNDENDATPLEETIRKYATQEALAVMPADKLTETEQRDYKFSIAAVAISKVLDNKKRADFIEESREALESIGEIELANTIEQILTVVELYEEN